MPRQKRLDIPGILHHVVTRGIDKTELFKDNADSGGDGVKKLKN